MKVWRWALIVCGLFLLIGLLGCDPPLLPTVHMTVMETLMLQPDATVNPHPTLTVSKQPC